MNDRVGQQLGNYRLLRALGRGGFATVYLGEHVYLKSLAALKVLHTHLSEEDATQFIQEAQTLAGLSHPHIVRVLDFAVQDSTPFLVMEYAPGGTLRQRHPKETRLPLETIVSYVSQVASALQYAHDQRLIHRDVKPENMLLNARDEVVLSDFGLVILAPNTLSGSTQAMDQAMAGTAPYAAPEQLQGRPRPASDQYALGVVVYEWLCGKRPFTGSPFEIAMQQLSTEPPPLHEQVPDLSRALEKIVLRALAKNPKERFASVQDFAQALAREVNPQLPSIPPLHIRLLGDFLLLSGETTVANIDMPRLQSLLAYLLLHRTAPQSRSHLAFLLWPDSTEAQALTNLRNLVHKLRQTLPNADTFLHVERQSIQWRTKAPWTLDVQDFEEVLAQAEQAERSGQPATVRETLTRAVDLYRGDLAPSCYDEWILPERDRLREKYQWALERLMEVLEHERDYQGAIHAAQRLLRHDPLHEATYRQLMRLYALLGDRAAALRIYHTCATVLERELAAEPSRPTREAYERLLHTEEPSTLSIAAHTTMVAAAPLVGRKSEWAQLQAAWHKVVARDGRRPQLVVLSGEAGIGKTRLAEELITWINRQGIAHASAHCYAAEGTLPYAPVAAWLRAGELRSSLPALPDVWLTEIARIVPEVLAERPDLPHPGPMTEGWQRQHFFEALARAILRTGTGRNPSGQPLLLLLDDLQWSDRETIEWLHYLLRFNTYAPLLLVGTVRSEDMTAEHPLATLLKSVRRDGIVTEIALGPLDAGDTASLAESLAGQHLDHTRVNDLYRETEGNPLFIVETVRAGALAPHESGANSNAETPPRRHSALPPTVQAVIAARFDQLSPLAREIVNLAAVIGRAFTFDVLQQASDESEDTLVNGLDELWQRRIVREQTGGTYDFSHDKLREYAYASLSTARRRLLHRRVGDALVSLHVDDAIALNSISGQIAAHYEQAGAFEQAIVYSVQAAEDARRTYANTEALAAYRRALSLLEEVSTSESKREWRQEIAVQCYESIGEILALTGDVEAAREAYERALVKVILEDHIRRAGLQRKIAKAQEKQHRYEEALQAYSASEAALGSGPPGSAFDWWQEWIEIQDGKMDTLASLSRMSEALEVLEKLRPVVAQYGTAMQRAEFFFSSSLSASRVNRFVVSPEMLAEARAGLAAYEALGNLVKIGWSHFTVGSLYEHQDSLTEAEKHLREALSLGERTGDVLLQMRSVSFLALVSRKRGQVEEARHTILRALSMAEAMHQPAYIALNKANLAWVAWRRGSLAEALEHGRAALKEWQVLPIVYYSQWTALLPLMDIALTRDLIAEAVDNARAMLAPDQQQLPDALSNNLEAAIQVWETNQLDRTRTHLQQAIVSARKIGYL